MDLFAHKIIPIVVLHHASDAEPLGEALIEGGLPIAEVTFRTPAAAEGIAVMSEIDGLTVGAGTVLTPQQVELAVEVGAQFIASPGLRTDVVQESRLTGKPILAGAVTATEIMTALALGLETVEFFPAHIYSGTQAIKALSEPFTTMQFVPTGRISESNLAEYLSLPCVPAVSGSWMVPPHLIEEHEFAVIARLCRQAVDLVNSLD